MLRMLLISSTGRPYFEQCKETISRFLGTGKTLGFISAANLFNEKAYFRRIEERLINTDPAVARRLLHIPWDTNQLELLDKVDGILIGGGNTYTLLKRLKDSGLFEAIRGHVQSGLPYIGSSAGANIVGPNILTTNDWNVSGLTDFKSLNLIPLNVNPHYIERSSAEAVYGESKEERIREYHQIWSNPVAAIEENALLKAEDDNFQVIGPGSIKLFEQNRIPRWYRGGENIELGAETFFSTHPDLER
ncbi:MAG: dipeptidase PepE [Nitrosospira sp.]